MYPEISDLLYDLFGIRLPFPIHSFGFFLAIAFLAAAIILLLEFKRKAKAGLIVLKKKASDHTVNIIFIGIIAGIVGSKLFHNLEHLDELLADPLNALFSLYGLTFYGGFILATFAIIVYSRMNNIPVPVMADIVAPSIILAYGIGRIGCQFAGDGDWGIDNLSPKPTWLGFIPDWLWAYNYPHNILNQGILIEGCTGKHCFVLVNPVFPTPVYETIMCVILFLALWLIRRRLSESGVLFGILLIFMGVERFLIEQIRINVQYNIFGFNATQAEIISILLIITGMLLIWMIKKKLKIPVKLE
jgi:phosphatidylglycerol---prolipoprotein diacylglyceryl transferase